MRDRSKRRQSWRAYEAQHRAERRLIKAACERRRKARIRYGGVLMGTTCQRCGVPTTNGERHHVSYVHQVIWYVCRSCHKALERDTWLPRMEREAKARMDYQLQKGAV